MLQELELETDAPFATERSCVESKSWGPPGVTLDPGEGSLDVVG